MKNETFGRGLQKRFDFSPPQPRHLANLSSHIDTYEERVAQLFRWRTGLDYYHAVDQIVDFVINTRRTRVIDLLTDTATFALRLAGRKAFSGRIYSFDTNVTLLARAKQRAFHLNLQDSIEFRQFEEPRLPLPDGYGELAVSFFDFHRHQGEQYLSEILRILSLDGYLILAEMLEPKSIRNSWAWTWKRIQLKYVQKNPNEACGVYRDREEIIDILFRTGFRQVIIQGLKKQDSAHSGVFSLIAATK